MIQKEKKSGFVAGTLVHTDKGLVPIQDIKVGDLVLSRYKGGDGELVYKPVVRTFVTENVLVYAIRLTPALHMGMKHREIIELDERYKENYLLVTANHPFWVEDRGWVRADQIEVNQKLILKDGTRVTFSGAALDRRMIVPVYQTLDPLVGFIPDYGDERGQSGVLINLSTGAPIEEVLEYSQVSNALFVRDETWHSTLLEQLPEDERDSAAFYGFKQGYWRDPDTIQWGEGEGPLTMTVYNFEVADTHTYFVGKHGVCVHDASANIS